MVLRKNLRIKNQDDFQLITETTGTGSIDTQKPEAATGG